MAWPRGERSSSAATLAAGSALLLLLLLPELSPTPGVAAVSKADFRSVDVRPETPIFSPPNPQLPYFLPQAQISKDSSLY